MQQSTKQLAKQQSGSSSVPTSFKFGCMQIPSQLVFLQKSFSYCMIPLRMSIAPGHIIIVPKRQVIDFKDLETGEIFEVSLTVRSLTACLEKEYQATSSLVYVQSYSKNENSIDHCFIHIIPRRGIDKKDEDLGRAIESFSSNFIREYNNTIGSNNGYSQTYIEELSEETYRLTKAVKVFLAGMSQKI